MSQSKLIHTLSESKNIFASERKAIVLSFLKNIAFLLGHPVGHFDKSLHDDEIKFEILRNVQI